jgi:hypothetical protein
MNETRTTDRLGALSRRDVLSLGSVGLAAGLLPTSVFAATNATKVLIFVGPSKHPPGTHEVPASGRLLKHCLDSVKIPNDLLETWPKDGDALKAYSSIVFLGDYFPPAVIPESRRAMEELAQRMNAGMGLVCVHYATGLTATHVQDDGDHPLLRWMGGYFATRCKHHQSVAKVFKDVKVNPGPIDHPTLRGWKGFTFDDEPYIGNWFGKDGPTKNVVTLATAMLPPEKPQQEIIAWGVERPDGGRGVGVVFPHFYRNWKNDDLRTFILNTIAWTAKREVPKEGLRTELPDLSAFKPDSVDPLPPKKK